MENVTQSDAWKKLGLSLEAVAIGLFWNILVRRPGISMGTVKFKAKTRLEYGQMDPYDAFIGLCETVVGMPREVGEDAYQIWLSYNGLKDTNDYRRRFKMLCDQRDGLFGAFGEELVQEVAVIRPADQRKRVLPA
jgi:hypothetical protein